MPRRSCQVTEVALARVIRAARKEGARIIRIELPRTILIDLIHDHGENPQLAKERVADREAKF